MDTMMQKLPELLSRYKYVLLIAAIGIVFMLLPAESPREQAPSAEDTVQSLSQQEQLEQILSKIDGVGSVRVLLTVAQGEKTLYEYDEDSADGTDSMQLRRETVLITDSDRSQTGLVRQVIPPVYQGAVVVCKGADSAAVRLAVVQAVSAATGLSADRISVLKMK